MQMKCTAANGNSVFFFQAEDGIRDHCVTGVQTCALPISHVLSAFASDAALILAHQEVAAAPGEVPAVPELIAELGLTGVLFTADALHCQKRALNKLPRPAPPWSPGASPDRSVRGR